MLGRHAARPRADAGKRLRLVIGRFTMNSSLPGSATRARTWIAEIDDSRSGPQAAAGSRSIVCPADRICTRPAAAIP
jgi:hypothetical protein